MNNDIKWPFPADATHPAMKSEPEFDESSVQSHAGLADLDEVIERARADHLAGKPGELHFAIEIKKPDGRVERHTLIGMVTEGDPS